MVSLVVKLDESTTKILGLFKEYYGFKNKSDAINAFLTKYGSKFIKDEINQKLIADILKMSKNKEKYFTEMSFKELDALKK